jgi:hypothetical protein
MTASQKKVVQYLSKARASKLALHVQRATGRARAFGKAPFDRGSGGEEKVLRVAPPIPDETLTVQDLVGKLAKIDVHERERLDPQVSSVARMSA